MIVWVRGGGDLATGVAARLWRTGLKIVVTELAQPLMVRRSVSFAQAVYAGEVTVEGIRARRVQDSGDTLRVLQILSKGQVPVLVDPDGLAALSLHPTVIVDARLLKRTPEPIKHQAKLYIGLGPGFTASQNCHVVIETNRGPRLGRAIWQGSASDDTGIPEGISGESERRVLRAPADGHLVAHAEIGMHVEADQLIASVGAHQVIAPFKGVLRGLIQPGLEVHMGQKIGDLDPRDDPSLCEMISDKALAVGGGVLEAILSVQELRPLLWK
jgi:xanthine dehydrogenase accessory factor